MEILCHIHSVFARYIIVNSGAATAGEYIMSPQLLTVAQFKERYQISHTAFYRQVKTGQLAIAKIGSSTRIRLADAESWAASLPALTGGAA
jgi:hypothetical protein